MSTASSSQSSDRSLDRQREDTRRLSEKFESLAFDHNDGDDGDFLSGWQCSNGLVADLEEAIRARAKTIDHTRYNYFDTHADLIAAIQAHHRAVDDAPPAAVLCGGGATALLSVWATYLHSRGVDHVYYIPPLYITLQTALDRYGIRTIPVAATQPYEPGFSVDLPIEDVPVLLLTDPVWYAGTPVAAAVIDEIARWQCKTAATIFVDGSLQYMPWAGERYEPTGALDPSRTFRLVCPSKQLCMHGYRFSYLLIPPDHSRRLAWTYTNLVGPAAADSIAFAHEAIAAVSQGDITRALMQNASDRYQRLIATGSVRSVLRPSAGYFVFAEIVAPLAPDYVRIDGSYFGQTSYPGYMKLNLLSPSLGLIDPESLVLRPDLRSQGG